MAFGIDDAILLMMAAASTASAMQPKPTMEQAAAPAGSTPGGSAMQPNPMSSPTANPQPINTEPLQGLASELGKGGSPPPQQQMMPQMNQQQPGQMGPPVPTEDPVVQAMKNEASWKGILAAAPQAIAMAAPLLGMGQDQGRTTVAPAVGANTGGNAMQMPGKRPSLGEILQSLRM